MKTIKVSRISETAVLPTRKHKDDAGMDLYSNEGASIDPHGSMTARTGIKVSIPEGNVGLIWPKSRDSFVIGAGVVDAGYQGEILVKIINTSQGILQVRQGDAIAQLLIMPVRTPVVLEVAEGLLYKNKSARGATGGIVTGTSLLGLVSEEEAKASVALDHDENMGTHSEEEKLI